MARRLVPDQFNSRYNSESENANVPTNSGGSTPTIVRGPTVQPHDLPRKSGITAELALPGGVSEHDHSIGVAASLLIWSYHAAEDGPDM